MASECYLRQKTPKEMVKGRKEHKQKRKIKRKRKKNGNEKAHIQQNGGYFH